MTIRPSTRRFRLRRTARLCAALALLSLAAVPGFADEQATSSDDPTLTSVATMPELHGANAVTLDGDLAYVAFRGGLAVVDVSTPWDPALLHVEPMDELYLPDESIELGSDTLVMSLDSWDTCTALENCELAVFDRTDPTTPTLVSTLEVPHHNASCLADCTAVYLDNGRIIDLRDPAAPVDLGQHPVLRELALHEMQEVGDGLMVTVGSTLTVSLLDVSDPFAPVLLKETVLDDHPMVVSDDRAQRATLALDGPRPLLYVGTFGGAFEPDCDADDGGTNLYLVDPAPLLEALDEEAEEITQEFDVVGRHHWAGLKTDGRPYKINCITMGTPHPDTPSLVATSFTRGGIQLIEVDESGDIEVVASTTQPAPVGGAEIGIERESNHALWLDDEWLVSVDALHGLEFLHVDR